MAAIDKEFMNSLMAQYAQMPWADLISARKALPPNSPGQQILAPAEHRADAREFAQYNPVTAALTRPFFIPGYQAFKMLGGGGPDATPASWDQLIHGYKGLWEGLKNPK